MVLARTAPRVDLAKLHFMHVPYVERAILSQSHGESFHAGMSRAKARRRKEERVKVASIHTDLQREQELLAR